jgi:hypothetical protein
MCQFLDPVLDVHSTYPGQDSMIDSMRDVEQAVNGSLGINRSLIQARTLCGAVKPEAEAVPT